ncbi:DUF3089 domain-containing protein [uncultured Flavonifractor sp.]|uniref:DUF3089 domain-containing protein n=1 Tax=uncultured Flavonifractor sp. TaxID=1193534 RepID=UPI002601C45F|nr:DUF3089 domain-containing protein [uncultured Flavonifractor sp.]
MRTKNAALLLALAFLLALAGCGTEEEASAYARPESWAYLETDKAADADVFFLCPTVYAGGEDSFNMSMDDEATKSDFLGAINMEKGIYDENCRFFAPYYRQVGLNVYLLPAEERESYLELAYEDVKEAFTYYLDHYNDGQPILVAGFSQGADMSLRLLKDCFAEEEINRLLVACYAVGWSITEEELAEYPHLRFAAGADDTGVIISFNSESEEITDSVMIPSGTRTLAINPLNWKTDGTPAGREENLGACFTDYGGNIVTEIPQLTGAYLDPVRGALKVTDVTPEEYPAMLPTFADGIYHIYDYQFFYRNLQENVGVRLNAYLAERGSALSALSAPAP